MLRYLKGTIGLGVLYKKGSRLDIIGYSDADWVGSNKDRRSTSGHCVFIVGNLVTWTSKKQTVVARSSAKVEYKGMAHTTCELEWIKNLLRELHVKFNKPLTMFCDNQAIAHIAKNPLYHERTTHIEVNCHFIRKVIMKGEVYTSYIKST